MPPSLHRLAAVSFSWKAGAKVESFTLPTKLNDKKNPSFFITNTQTPWPARVKGRKKNIPKQ